MRALGCSLLVLVCEVSRIGPTEGTIGGGHEKLKHKFENYFTVSVMRLFYLRIFELFTASTGVAKCAYILDSEKKYNHMFETYTRKTNTIENIKLRIQLSTQAWWPYPCCN